MPRREAGGIQVIHKLPHNVEDNIGRLDVLQIHPLLRSEHRNEYGRSGLSLLKHTLDALQLSRLANPAMACEEAATRYLRPGYAPRQFLLDIVRGEIFLLLPIHIKIRLLHLQRPRRIELAVKRPQNIHRFDCTAPRLVFPLGPMLLSISNWEKYLHGIRNSRTLYRNQRHRLRGRLPGGLHPSQEG